MVFFFGNKPLFELFLSERFKMLQNVFHFVFCRSAWQIDAARLCSNLLEKSLVEFSDHDLPRPVFFEAALTAGLIFKRDRIPFLRSYTDGIDSHTGFFRSLDRLIHTSLKVFPISKENEGFVFHIVFGKRTHGQTDSPAKRGSGIWNVADLDTVQKKKKGRIVQRQRRLKETGS